MTLLGGVWCCPRIPIVCVRTQNDWVVHKAGTGGITANESEAGPGPKGKHLGGSGRAKASSDLAVGRACCEGKQGPGCWEGMLRRQAGTWL
eukprot:712780-Pelagomonas_calceolata.AAC.2